MQMAYRRRKKVRRWSKYLQVLINVPLVQHATSLVALETMGVKSVRGTAVTAGSDAVSPSSIHLEGCGCRGERVEGDASFLSSLLQAKIPKTLFNGRRKGRAMRAGVSVSQGICKLPNISTGGVVYLHEEEALELQVVCY